MKILLVGDGHSEIHEKPLESSWKSQGHDVHSYYWHQHFASGAILSRFQNKFLLGPKLDQINRDIVNRAAELEPDLVFIYRGTHVRASTLRRIRERAPKAILIGYNNDDPFSPRYPFYLWRHFRASIREYDLLLAYRHANLEDLKRHGARRAQILRSWYLPEKNRPVALSAEDCERFGSDVSFVGHFEPDGREKWIEQLVGRDFRFHLFGPEWDRASSEKIRSLGSISPVRGEDYNKAINATKIALCFLSRLNRDTYTRRNFEIPAAGVFMLSERTDDLSTLFKEGEEAEFFRTPEEMLEKIRRYLKDEPARSRIASAGRKRVQADGHDVGSRAAQIVAWAEELRRR